jgi:hypothetical protein
MSEPEDEGLRSFKCWEPNDIVSHPTTLESSAALEKTSNLSNSDLFPQCILHKKHSLGITKYQN